MRKLITTSILSLLFTAGAFAQCTAGFTQTSSVMNPLMVSFTNTSNVQGGGNFIAYDWYFGDGNSSTATNPNHTYATAGTYQVCLIAGIMDSLNGSYLCLDSTCVNVTVTMGNPPNPLACNASFWVDSIASNATGINIYNSSTPLASANSSVSYSWDFGDGNSSTAQFPVHQYASSGLYNLCLTIMVVDSGRTCTDTYCHTIGVDSLGNVYFKTNGPGFTLNVLDPAQIGLEENLLSNVSLYPNPANDKLNIDLGVQIDGQVTWTIVDLKGSRLATGELSQINSDIDVNALNAGFYILTIESGASSTNHKVQIVK